MDLSMCLVLGAEFGPILLFFIAGRLTDFFTAVAIVVVSTIVVVIINWLLKRQVPWRPVLSAVFVIFGGIIILI